MISKICSYGASKLAPHKAEASFRIPKKRLTASLKTFVVRP
jgi:hypothetical protein